MELRRARIAAGVTQVEAAKRLGRPQSFVSKCESGERRVDVAEYLALCQAFGIDPCAIIKELTSDPTVKSGRGKRAPQ